MRTSNPALREGTFSHLEHGVHAMTVQGTVIKTCIMLLLLLFTAGWTWMKFYASGGQPESVQGWLMFGLFGGLILAMVTIFKQQWAPFTAPFYALFEGFVIGGLSSLFEVAFPGIVIQATALTFGTLFSLLALYQSGIIKVTEQFRFGVVAATGGIAIVYIGALILSFFGISLSFLFEGGLFGIAFSLFVVAIAAMNLVLDFDLIDRGAAQGAPKYMEWYGAFALMVTLIWLYIELLRLLSKMRQK